MRVCGPRLQHFFQMWPAVQKVCPPLYGIDPSLTVDNLGNRTCLNILFVFAQVRKSEKKQVTLNATSVDAMTLGCKC